MGNKIAAWRKWIEQRGVLAVSRELDIHYETVRGWVRYKQVPSSKNKQKLVKLAGGTFGFESFYE